MDNMKDHAVSQWDIFLDEVRLETVSFCRQQLRANSRAFSITVYLLDSPDFFQRRSSGHNALFETV